MNTLIVALLCQLLILSNTYAVDVTINGSEKLTLMNDIIFDYQNTPKVIDFDVADPFLCTAPFNDPSAPIILDVNSILSGNKVASASFDLPNDVFNVYTDSLIQCATRKGIHNDIIFDTSFEQGIYDLKLLLIDTATGISIDPPARPVLEVLLSDGQIYKYKYIVLNNGNTSVNADVIENYLLASPYFISDPNVNIDIWTCVPSAGSNCGDQNTGSGEMLLTNAVIDVGGQLDIDLTRRVKADNVGPNERLDLLAAVFVNGNNDSNLTNNVSFESFGTTIITATQLNITSLLNNTVAGEAISSVVVELLDANGALDANNNSMVTISIDPSSPSGGTLSGTGSLSVAAVNGIAVFSGLSIDKANTGYKLKVSSGSLTIASSNSFNITAGQATQLVIITQPTNTSAGAPIPDIRVEAHDEFGNFDATNNSFAQISIKAFSGSPNAALSGTNIKNISNGFAIFSGLNIDLVGTAYVLAVDSDVNLDSVDSNPFNITDFATQLVVTSVVINQVAGVSLSDITVELRYANGNIDLTNNSSVTIEIDPSSPSGGTLSGGTGSTVSATNGIATFSGLSIDKADMNYILKVTSNGLTSDTTNAFNIAAGLATQLVVINQPISTIVASQMSNIVLQAQDAFGNLDVTNNSFAQISIKAFTGTLGAVLTGMKTKAVTNGIVTFDGLSIDLVGTDYQLTIESNVALDTVHTQLFNITQ